MIVCRIEDIPNGGQLAVRIYGNDILLLRAGDQVHALENRCPHLDLPLTGGRRIGCEIVCPHHGARFDLDSGKVLGGAAFSAIRTFKVKMEAGTVNVLCDDQTANS